MDLDDRYKRPNQETGKPFEEGFEDINGRVFVRRSEEHTSELQSH